MKTITSSMPIAGWKTLLVSLISLALLAGCNDSSDGGSDDDNGGGDGNGGDNGGSGGASNISEADSVLVFEQVSGNTRDRVLIAVDIDDANARAEIDVVAQDNAFARDEGWFWPPGSLSLAAPDDSNLPLGVLEGSPNGDNLNDAGFRYTIFNAEDGNLYRVDTRAGESTAERFSAENSADVVCASFVATDLANVDNSRLVYQVAKETSCEDTEIRMARIGDDESGSVVTLHDAVEADDSFQTKNYDLGTWLLNSDGSLAEVITFNGLAIQAHDVDAGSNNTLSDSGNFFRKLGWLDNQNTMLYMGNSFGLAAYSAGESVDAIGSETMPSLLTSSQVVNVDNTLYIVDHEDGNASTGRVVSYDGTSLDTINSDWGSASAARQVTTANGYLAFAYSAGTNWHVHQVALDGSSHSDLVEDINRAIFPIDSPQAPGSNDSYWFLYTDLGDQGDDPVARGIEFTDGGGSFALDNARWEGQTWSRDVGSAGPQAEYLVYQQESGGTDQLFSVAGDDPANATASDLGLDEDLYYRLWVGGFGSQSLITGRESNNHRPDAIYIDASAANSSVRLTESSADERPVPFY